jgi:putative transposase
MQVKKAFRYRIYPNREQQAALANQFGQVRFVYNHFLTQRREHFFAHGKGLNYSDTAEHLTALKKKPDYIWLKEGNAQAQQQALRNLDRAYQNFFRKHREGTLPPPGRKPRKDGMPKGYPSYHSRHDDQSLTIPQNFKYNGHSFYLPKVGWIRTVFHRPLEGEPGKFTVSKTKSGNYYVSIQCEMEVDEPDYSGNEVGIDLGLADFITASDGLTVSPPRHLRQAEKKLKRLQRQLSRKQKGSRGRENVRVKLARQHEKVANRRRDFQHKLSRKLVTPNRLLCFENLNVAGMLKNHHHAKAIADAAWSEFVRQCTYKGGWYGCYVEKVGRFYPSSKLCSVCGEKHYALKLSERKWLCAGCGTVHHRDENASKNILAEGQRLHQTTVGATESYAGGETIRPDVSAVSMKPEAHLL